MHESRIQYEGSRREFLEVLGEHDTPAYVHRGVRTEGALRDFMSRCQQQRDTLLEFCRLRVAQLAALIGQDWSRIDDHTVEPMHALPHSSGTNLGEASMYGSSGAYLSVLHQNWQYELRVEIRRSDSSKAVRRSLREVVTSFESFNAKWEQFLSELDFSEINQIRRDYNDYYVCEKAAALQSEKLAAHGFERLPPITVTDVRHEMPLLCVPRLR